MRVASLRRFRSGAGARGTPSPSDRLLPRAQPLAARLGARKRSGLSDRCRQHREACCASTVPCCSPSARWRSCRLCLSPPLSSVATALEEAIALRGRGAPWSCCMWQTDRSSLCVGDDARRRDLRIAPAELHPEWARFCSASPNGIVTTATIKGDRSTVGGGRHRPQRDLIHGHARLHRPRARPLAASPKAWPRAARAC